MALVAALLEACEFCDAPENRNELIATLARPEYVGVSADALRRGFDGRLDLGHGRVHAVQNFNVFYEGQANEPSVEKAAWVIQHLRNSGRCKDGEFSFGLGRQIFRADIFEKAAARKLRTANSKRNCKSQHPNDLHENELEDETILA